MSLVLRAETENPEAPVALLYRSMDKAGNGVLDHLGELGVAMAKAELGAPLRLPVPMSLAVMGQPLTGPRVTHASVSGVYVDHPPFNWSWVCYSNYDPSWTATFTFSNAELTVSCHARSSHVHGAALAPLEFCEDRQELGRRYRELTQAVLVQFNDQIQAHCRAQAQTDLLDQAALTLIGRSRRELCAPIVLKLDAWGEVHNESRGCWFDTYDTPYNRVLAHTASLHHVANEFGVEFGPLRRRVQGLRALLGLS